MPTPDYKLTAFRAELLALAEGLAQGLGSDEWTVDPRRIPDWHPCVELVRTEDRARVLIQQERLRPDRWGVHGTLPDSSTYYYRHDLTGGNITVTRAKTPAQVARDVQRRLLPDLDAAVAEMSRRQHQHLTDVHEVTAVASRLKAVPLTTGQPPGEANRRNGEDTTRTLSWNQGPGTSWSSPHAVVKVQRSQFGGVEITCSHLTPDMAEAVLRALTTSLPATAQAA
ncbi:hypothetical protein OG455_39210 [Kitasatospora sp. NBC_01287]|uniref:hypothetical protein n=1 Tax=Kitasatospora sp. NBC_01287 TaxID=2903573 RepID=UPI0022549BD7|nr:hypothetical protein [Kitasatospora sp. NBC_01287]MCX4751466.1 hypothetical protein [Kitasatospora sp. NBC_01287]